jgi:hypothetical protein
LIYIATLIFENIPSFHRQSWQSWHNGGSIISQPWSRPALRFLHTKNAMELSKKMEFYGAGIKA